MSKMLVIRALLTVFLLGGTACKPSSKPAVEKESTSSSGAENAVDLVFTYGSEKQKWIEAVTKDFHAAGIKTKDGKAIHVQALPMGSGDCVNEVLSGKRQPHIISPASAAFLKLGTAESQTKTGKPLVGEPVNLVLSPVVIAMWEPMAKALGWPEKPVGWKDIQEMAMSPQGWAGKGFPQWGAFRFGHTHPEFSNSGLISVLAEVYAASGKVRGLDLADVGQPRTAEYLKQIESAVVHYGESTGFFGRKMFSGGPRYLSAAVLYENMVIESLSEKGLPFPLVAIYPKEGTFWSDHPAAIVERDWVTPEHREAARKYLDFLTARPQQERAMEFGFRPGDVGIPLGAPFDAAHGVNPKEPQTTLDVPEAAVIQAALDLWRVHKKKSHVSLVMDVSGSMQENDKIRFAKEGARSLISMLGSEDTLSILPFNNTVNWAMQDQVMSSQRSQATTTVNSFFADGGTALYDAILTAHRDMKAKPTPDKISALVVLTDGADTNSKAKLDQVLRELEADQEGGGIRVFTIGYGKDAQAEVLEKIANTTRAKFYRGTTENIEAVFKEISTFF
ncbi:MAG: substrate-binding and VWA domain-containing protein [Luteolibacter sp.]|uniref:substrate-binding and vWA domain-containing protein n=1 Tax=Luteolibacter sp. TaxID=1962973 RepID=UPI0032635CE6